MSTGAAPENGFDTIGILRGALAAIRASPSILVVFLLAGVLGNVAPNFLDGTITTLTLAIGVVIAYRALGGRISADSPFLLRLVTAWLATLIALVPVVLGLFALIVPGIYVYVRLFLATPAVMIDGHGPFGALSESWRLMGDSVLAGAGALTVVVLVPFIALVLLLVAASPLVTALATVVGTIIVSTLSAGVQAFLYLTLAETA